MALLALPEDWDRALAVVAHPDDLEFGASSAVARWTGAGKVVEYVLATRGEAGIDAIAPEQCRVIRSAEQMASARVVGVDRVSFLDHPDGTLTYSLELRRDIARSIRSYRPDILVSINYHASFGPGSPNHADHRVLGEALLDAARDAANRWVFPELAAEGLEPWHGLRFAAFNASPEADHFVDVTDYLDRGIASLAEHRVYLENLQGEFDLVKFLRSNAEQAGLLAGVPLAVTFEVVRF
ncbi:MAG: PIG-L deacetylase family protein [Acidimicrobiales bacterium]